MIQLELLWPLASTVASIPSPETTLFRITGNGIEEKILWTQRTSSSSGGRELLRTAAEASAAVRRRRHGGERDCTPGAEPPKLPLVCRSMMLKLHI
ncbi:unnamed protein product [Boreogadus saida]